MSGKQLYCTSAVLGFYLSPLFIAIITVIIIAIIMSYFVSINKLFYLSP